MRNEPGPCKDTDSEASLIVIAPAAQGNEARQVPSELETPPPDAGMSNEDSAQCREILGGLVDGGFLTDMSGRITAVNDLFCTLVQMSSEELAGLQVYQLISGADKSLMTTVRGVLDRRKRVRIEADVLRKDGTACPCEVGVGSVVVGGLKRAMFVARGCVGRHGDDHSEHAPDSETVVSRRVETAATVAGQIAHDFDNLLTPLFAYPELIRRDLPEKCRGRELLDIMEKTAHDMSKITQQLLSLSKRGQHKMAPFSINETVQRVAAMLHDLAADRNIDISTNLAGDLLQINGASEQMLRVVQNLCQNSMDAMEEGGRLELTTRNVYLDRPGGHHGKLGVGEYVELIVTDNGSGIPDNVRDKIFDPFFTTRKTSKSRGSGLGLSVVRGIVDDHKGSIQVDSTVGKGTTFSLYFPIWREDARGGTGAGLDKGATVLIVDDDAQQRDILARLFECHDFKVKALPSGERAVDYIAECGASGLPGKGQRFPDLVLLDVVMDPGMDGREACKRMLEINPRQRIILVSGYSVADSVATKQAVSNVSHLSKPLTWQSISRELQRVSRADTAVTPRGLVPRKANRILVVDDEEGIRKLFHMILAAAFPKADVELTGNGADAVSAFKDRHHAVIVMDLRMPVLSGEAAFEKISEFCVANNWEQPKVVFCTGFAPSDVVKKIVSSGEGHSILSKPVSGDALVAAAGEHLPGVA